MLPGHNIKIELIISYIYLFSEKLRNSITAQIYPKKVNLSPTPHRMHYLLNEFQFRCR